MANPGVAGSQIPFGEDFAQRQIKDLQRDLRELAPSIAKSFAPVIARLEATDADLIAKQAAIEANLASINSLLTQMVKPQRVYASDSSFALSTTTTTMKSVTITVPAGFTSAVVNLTSRVYAINPNTTGGSNGLGADWLYSKTVIDGNAPVMLPQAVGGSNGSGINVAPYSEVLTGLTPGGTFVVSADARSGSAAWATNASNFVDLSGSIQWFR